MDKCLISSDMLEQYLTNADPEIASKAAEIFEQAEREKMSVIIHPVVMFACLENLSAKFSRAVVSDALTRVLLLDGVTAPEKETAIVALDIYGQKDGVSFPDAYLTALNQKGYGELVERGGTEDGGADQNKMDMTAE